MGIEEENEIYIPDIPTQDISIIEKYVQIDAAIQALEQLNQTFLFNVNAFAPLRLQYDDYVKNQATGEDVDFITVNALFINLISAGRILVDKIDVVLKEDMGKDLSERFRSLYLSNIYDHVFVYRFFYLLRNVCQHGFVPVSRRQDGRFCFDFQQLMELRHFNYNGNFRNELKTISDEIIKEYGEEPNICFSKNVDDYIKAIYEVYYRLLDYIDECVNDVCKDVETLLSRHPEYVCNAGPLAGFVIYKKGDGEWHALSSQVETLGWFRNIKQEAKMRFEKYDIEYHGMDR